MNFLMLLAPVLVIIGLFGLYDKIRLIRKNGVFPSDSRLYRWFAVLLLLILPVRNFQDDFQIIKVAYYILIPIVLIWLLYVHFREGKAYKIVDISKEELVKKIEQLLKNHKVKFIKEEIGKEQIDVLYKLSNIPATIVLNCSKDFLNETHRYSFILTFKKWWRLPSSEIIIDDLIRRLQQEREPLQLRKQKFAAFGYGIILLIGMYIAMNTFS